MKKMKKIQSKEANELVMALRVAGACAIEFIAIIVAIPAKIMLGVAGLMASAAMKLAGDTEGIIQHRKDSGENIITEITDM